MVTAADLDRVVTENLSETCDRVDEILGRRTRVGLFRGSLPQGARPAGPRKP